MRGTVKAGVAGQRRDVFAVDEDAALAALEDAWTEGGYHAFSGLPRQPPWCTFSAGLRRPAGLIGSVSRFPDEGAD
jgi:hypothetical protein